MHGPIMKSDPPVVDVIIIGGGFAGTMTTAHIVKRGLKIVLVEGSEHAGLGTAYSTRDAQRAGRQDERMARPAR